MNTHILPFHLQGLIFYWIVYSGLCKMNFEIFLWFLQSIIYVKCEKGKKKIRKKYVLTSDNSNQYVLLFFHNDITNTYNYSKAKGPSIDTFKKPSEFSHFFSFLIKAQIATGTRRHAIFADFSDIPIDKHDITTASLWLHSYVALPMT